jgi:hypothetical protein
MKKMILAISILTASFSFAQVAAEASLKTIMKEMSSKLRMIATQSTDPTKNASSEQITLELIKSVTAAKAVFPSSANDKNSQEKYLIMIEGVIASSTELAQAFHNNDNTKAADILRQLSQEKKDGHNEFKN